MRRKIRQLHCRICRLAWSHPLPDGNKRTAWASLVMFLDLNGAQWDPNPPDIEWPFRVHRLPTCPVTDGLVGQSAISPPSYP